MPKIKINYTAAQLADIAQQKQARKLANRAKRKELKNKLSKSEWKEFKGEEGAELPDAACFVKQEHESDPRGHNIFRYHGSWLMAYYKGDNPETATEWIVVTNNGGSYKHGCNYMIWHPKGSQATVAWSATKKSVKSLITEGVTVYDPLRAQFT